MPGFRRKQFAAILVGVLLFAAAPPMFGETPKPDGVDHSIKPGGDFYRFANGGWLATVTLPPGRESFDNRAIVREKTKQQVRGLMREAAVSGAAKGSIKQQVGDYYATFSDVEAIQKKGLAPVAAELASISAINDRAALSAYLGSTLNTEVEGLINNADHVFGLWVSQGFDDWTRNFPHLLQGGLGIADRDIYLDASTKAAQARAEYQAHVRSVLKQAGVPDPEAAAERVLALETEIARAHVAEPEASDAFKQNNRWRRTDFPLKAPGMDWSAYFDAAGLGTQTDFVVWHPAAIAGTAALVGTADLKQWKDYLRFHLLEHYADVLPKAEAQVADREDAAIAATNGALGQAVAQLYTERYFPPAARSKAQEMARNLVNAYRARILNLTWMTAETKKKALAKLDALTIGVGYPDRWIDYSSLEIVRGDAYGNMRRAEQFNRQRNLALLKRPADAAEWTIHPQTAGAIIMFSPNSEFFSAALLQPPYFDAQGDDAFNYGSAGAAMAHEITHSFDELGNIYDDRGRLARWWTAQDARQYQAAAAKLVAQFNGYCPSAGFCVNGTQVLNENAADLAGLLVAHDAYVSTTKGKPDVVIGGWNGEQRFFLAFAQRWRTVQSEGALRKQMATDIHPPGEYRSDTVRNVDGWYRSYQVEPGDRLYLNPEDRVAIW